MRTSPPSSPALAAAGLALALLLAGGPAASATRPEPAAVARASQAETWKGRFCTANACRPAPASPLGAAASFGAAILAIRWLTRRPGAPAPGLRDRETQGSSD